jgi:hypothetical protein
MLTLPIEVHVHAHTFSEGSIMSKSAHKFQEKMQSGMTYEQYFRSSCQEKILLAEELERVVGRKKALEVMGKARERYIVEMTKRARKPVKNFEEFCATEKAENAFPYMSNTVTLTYPEETPNKLKIHVTECLYAKVYKEMNATDLGYVLCCQPDFAYAQACHPKLRLKRSKILMQGDSCCNHTYYWEK